MASQILVDSATMEAAISAYTTAKEQKMTAISAMKSAVEALKGAWESEAATVFQDKFASLYTTLLNSETIMEDAVTDLQNTLNTMISHESGQKTAMDGLSTGTVLM